MKILTAPDKYVSEPNEVSIFLAGGIQNTEDWQKLVIEELKKEFNDSPIVIFNPRRENFPIHDPSAAYEQITWEYNMLQICDVFSMYYAGNTKSDQPICMYEYGKHLERRDKNNDLDRFVVTSEPSYSRNQDVVIQTALVSKELVVGKSIQEHIEAIKSVLKNELIAKRIVE